MPRSDVERLAASWRSRFPALEEPQFTRFFLAQAISQVGFVAQMIGQVVLVLQLTDDALVLGAITSLQFGPLLLLGPWAGGLADRFDKRRIMLVTQVGLMLMAATIGVLALLDQMTVELSLALFGLYGVLTALDQPARRTIVVDLVHESHLSNAIGLSTAAGNFAQLIGPLVAAALTSLWGVGWCFIGNALSFTLVIAVLKRMRPLGSRLRPERTATTWQVTQTLLRRRGVRMRLLGVGAFSVTSLTTSVLVPLHVERDFAGSVTMLAVLMALLSLGSIVGSVLSSVQQRFEIRHLSASMLGYGVAMALLSAASTPAVAGLACALLGLAMMLVFNGAAVALQADAPPSARGAAMGVFSSVYLGGQGAAGLLAGVLVIRFGLSAASMFGTVASTSTAAALYWSRADDHVTSREN